MATTIDANNETMNAIPNGRSIRPSIPLRKKSGAKVTIIISVAFQIEARISVEAS